MDDSTRWSVYAGIYAVLVGTVLLAPLGVIARILVTVLGLSTGPTIAFVPVSGGVIGAIVWWGLIERRKTYTYVFGGVVGLLTALLTVLLWTLLVAIVYGVGIVPAAGVVILFASVVAAPVAFLAGVPMMYLRRNLASAQPEGNSGAPG